MAIVTGRRLSSYIVVSNGLQNGLVSMKYTYVGTVHGTILKRNKYVTDSRANGRIRVDRHAAAVRARAIVSDKS